MIDEVRVYNRAVSATEVTGIMGAPTSGSKAYWKLDENTGTTAADSSGSGNTGTLTSGAAWGTGQSGSATNLDGVNDYVQVGAQSSLVMTTAASFSAWIYPTGAGSNSTYGGTILVKEGEYIIARFPNGTIQWGFANSNPGWSFINTGYVAPLNQWTHIAVTYDNGTIKTYANGSLVHTYNGAGSIGDAITGQNDFRIGGRQGLSQHFQGTIDEVRVYNRTLSATEVPGIMSAPTSGLKGYWKLDENTGTTTLDSSGIGNTGTLTSGAGWGGGQSGSAVSLDGVDDYVQVGAQSSLVMTTAASFSAWIYPTGAGSNATYGGTVLVKEGEYIIARFPNGTIQWGFANSNPGWTFISTGCVAPLNQWTHIAVTYDNGTVKTYANGSLIHTYSGAGSIGDAITGQNDFRIGGRQGLSQHFQGRIDDVRVYNRALSATEITTLPSGGSGSALINWLVTDHLGTPRMIIDQTGSLASVKRHDYLPFGEELYAGVGGRTTAQGYSGDGVRQKFTQKERDNETDLDYFLARYYSAKQGRFTSPDEFSGGPDEYYEFSDLAAQNPTFYADLTDPQSLNKYHYAFNNPLLYIDPDGHQNVREYARWAWAEIKSTAGSVKQTAKETLNGAASALGEDNGLESLDAKQNSAGRAFGHGLALVQSGSEIAGGLSLIGGGGGEAVVTAPACGTGVGCAAPAVGVGAVVGGVALTAHGTLLGVNTLNNIFNKNSTSYEDTPENRVRMGQGKPPIGNDGKPVELHHQGQKPTGRLTEMTREQHRGKGNHGKNHPNRGPSKVDHGSGWKKKRQEYWKGKV